MNQFMNLKSHVVEILIRLKIKKKYTDNLLALMKYCSPF